MRVARRYVIAGRVQGVGFRWFTHDAAAREGVHGWVRNLADGSVEVIAEGDEPSVDRLEAAVRRGPSSARVERYDLEYGTDSLEMHSDAIEKGQKVLIVDDLLATGGTARATVDLVRQLGGDVHAVAVLIELVGLNGRSKLAGENVRAVLQY